MKRLGRALAAARCVLGAWAIGCTDAPTRPEPATSHHMMVPPLELWLVPPDRSSGRGSRQPTVFVRRGDLPLDDDLLVGVARRVSLLRWPDGTEVDGTVEVLPATAELPDDPELERLAAAQPGYVFGRQVRFVPGRALDDAWYALFVAPGLETMRVGPLVSRFRPGSDPVIARAEVHDAAGGKPQTIMLSLSEPVTTTDRDNPAGFQFFDHAGTTRYPCAPVPVGNHVDRHQFSCFDARIDTLSVRVGSGVQSAQGKTAPPVTLRLEPSGAWVSCGPKCRLFEVPLEPSAR